MIRILNKLIFLIYSALVMKEDYENGNGNKNESVV